MEVKNMKIWIIVLAIGLLAVAGFVIAETIQEDESVSAEAPSCGSCNGGCNAGDSCGNPSCGFEKTGSCGCQR